MRFRGHIALAALLLGAAPANAADYLGSRDLSPTYERPRPRFITPHPTPVAVSSAATGVGAAASPAKGPVQLQPAQPAAPVTNGAQAPQPSQPVPPAEPPPPPKPPEPPPPPLPVWTLTKGETLVSTLTRWAKAAGYGEPMRKGNDDWLVEVTPQPLTATFEDAVKYLEEGFQYQSPKPRILLSTTSKSILLFSVN